MPSEHDEHSLVYRLPRSAALTCRLWIGAGVVATVLAVLGGAAVVLIGIDQFTRHFLTTVPVIFALGAFLTGWRISRTPRVIVVSRDGLAMGRDNELRTHSWQEIGWATVQTDSLIHRRYLVIYDVDGRRIAKLSAAIEGFDELAELMDEHVVNKNNPTAAFVNRKKARRLGLCFGGVSVVVLLMTGCIAWMTARERRADRLLSEAGVPGDGQIEELYIAPNGRTRRLAYRITTPDGRSEKHDVQVTPAIWAELKGVKTVPIIYVPDDLSIGRLAEGEVPDRIDRDGLLGGYALCALSGGLSLFFGIGAIFTWYGWDIATDRKTGQLVIKRYGEPL
jgi:hypothetical protein